MSNEKEFERESLLESALLYASLGWHVFPLHNPEHDGSCSCGDSDCNRVGKHPRIKEWQNRATTDEDIIRKWWEAYPNANIGILTGEKSGVLVLDIDSATGGRSFQFLMRLCPDIEISIAAKTGKGFHLYFAYAEEEMKNKQGILPNIDIRGDGGYVVAPPSLHHSGKKYRWEDNRHPKDQELKSMPECLVDFIKMPLKRKSKINEGSRNAHLFRIGAALRGKGKEHNEILEGLLKTNAMLCDPPLSDAEVKKIARSASQYDPNDEPGESRETSIKAEDIIALATEEFELFHSPDKVGYAVVSIDGCREVMPVKSEGFKELLTKLCYDKFKRPAKAQPLQETINILNAQARYDFDEKKVHSRIAMEGDTIYIDLCNEEREVVQITPAGWDIIANSPVHFLSPASAKQIPRPQRGGSITDLRKFINVRDNDQWILLVAWLLKTFIPRDECPILTIQGEQGSAKSTTAEIMKNMIDPTKAPLRSLPPNKQDLYVSAVHSWVLGYDNLSNVPTWASDILCCLSTGSGGFAIRVIYTVSEEAIFEAQRPIIINGIEDLATRNDLANRTILVYLPSIPKEKRRGKSVILAELEEAKPLILGALLDAVSVALKNFPKVEPSTLPRMADFTRWIVAAEPALPWEPGEFMKAYERNEKEALDVCFEVDTLASIICEFAKAKKSWDGNATELLKELREFAPEETNDRSFPKAPNRLSGRLRRIAPSLRAAGVDYKYGSRKHGGTRRLSINIKE